MILFSILLLLSLGVDPSFSLDFLISPFSHCYKITSFLDSSEVTPHCKLGLELSLDPEIVYLVFHLPYGQCLLTSPLDRS